MHFYAPTSKDEGHNALLVFVCLSFCPSICPKLNLKTHHFLFTRLIFGMKARLIDTYLLEPRSSAKVKDKYQGHI